MNQWNGVLFSRELYAAAMVGVVFKLLTVVSYRRLLTVSRDMSVGGKSWVSILRKKFENYQQLQANVRNVSCIVDKYIENHRVCGFPARVAERMTGVCSLACVVTGFFGMMSGVDRGYDFSVILYNFSFSMVIAGSLLFLDRIINVDHKKALVRVNILYFLENVLPNRFEKKQKNQIIYQESVDGSLMKKQPVKEKSLDSEIDKDSISLQESAAAKEMDLSEEEIQAIKDFINDL